MLRSRAVSQCSLFALSATLFGALQAPASAQEAAPSTADATSVQSDADKKAESTPTAPTSMRAQSAVAAETMHRSAASPRPVSAAPPTSAVPTTFPLLALRPAPVDIAAFPARPLAQAAPNEPGVELHGFVAAWFTPWSETSPTSARDTYRLRFAVLRVDARPIKNVSVLARLGLLLPESPLLDFALSYTPHTAIGITVGQFRLPIGAAATTLSPQLLLLDRPTYVYSMTKLAFRDVGVMIHSGPRGIVDGLFHYRLVAASGGGRAGVGTSRAPEDLTKSLLSARAMLDLGRFVSGAPADRLVLGASYVRSSDPAIDTGDAARDRNLAGNVLGRTLAPIAKERVTQLGGADLTFLYGPFYSQAELLYLYSKARDETEEREGFGANLDLAYTLPIHPWNAVDLQLAGRGEHFNPRLDRGRDDLPNDELQLVSFGLNAIAGAARVSLFGTITFFENASTRRRAHAGELALRASASF